VTDDVDQVEVGPYLTKLCASLAASMTGGEDPIMVRVIAHPGHIPSSDAVSLGLIVTELVINAVKYAFPGERAAPLIMVTYEVDGDDWKLVISDNGVGKPPAPNVGLGTVIVAALVKQLDAQLAITSGEHGVTIAITHASFVSTMPKAA
jgi:chemotaxis protein methyltransferase CheR